MSRVSDVRKEVDCGTCLFFTDVGVDGTEKGEDQEISAMNLSRDLEGETKTFSVVVITFQK